MSFFFCRDLPYEDLLELLDSTKDSTLSFIGARSHFIPDPRESNILTLMEGAAPHIDGVDIKDQPSVLYKTGQWSTEKDILIGHTSGEFTVIELLPYPVDKDQATVCLLDVDTGLPRLIFIIFYKR